MNPPFMIDGRYIQDHFPGIGRYTFNLIDALARIAPNEKFCLLYNPALKNTRYDIATLARYPNVELVRVDVSTFSAREQFQLPVNSGQLYHSPYYIKPYFLRVPSVVTIHDLIPLCSPRGYTPSQRVLFKFAIRLALLTTRRVIAVSKSAANDLRELLHVPSDNITVIHEGVDARFRPIGRPDQERVRAKYALPEKYILYVGSNKPHKNLETLVAAWKRAEVNAGLVIASAWDERYGSVVSNQRSEVRLLKNVDDEDLPALYSAASIFVTASLYEGFGLPLLEAMACGGPCISSNASSLPEVGGDAVLYFDPHRVDALAELITRVSNDRVLQDELRGKSLARANDFTWERTARATLDMYNAVGAIRESPR